MSVNSEIRPTEDKELDLAGDFRPILAAGYAVHLWNTGGSVRVAEILKRGDQMGSQGVPTFGYGADGTAAEALTRARNSFYQREAEGKDQMTPADIKRADAGYITGAERDGTFLDKVASLSEISFYQEADVVVAEIPSITFGTERKAYGRGSDIVEALADLAHISGGRAF
jgi:hypothetical protein